MGAYWLVTVWEWSPLSAFGFSCTMVTQLSNLVINLNQHLTTASVLALASPPKAWGSHRNHHKKQRRQRHKNRSNQQEWNTPTPWPRNAWSLFYPPSRFRPTTLPVHDFNHSSFHPIRKTNAPISLMIPSQNLICLHEQHSRKGKNVVASEPMRSCRGSHANMISLLPLSKTKWIVLQRPNCHHQ